MSKPQASPRLAEAMSRSRGFSNLIRLDAYGRIACAAGTVGADPGRYQSSWFQALKAGEPVMNVRDVNALDIDGDFLKKENATLAILVLGGTKKRLGGNYSRENIERIGREELAGWNGGGEKLTQRLNACVAKAKPAQ